VIAPANERDASVVFLGVWTPTDETHRVVVGVEDGLADRVEVEGVVVRPTRRGRVPEPKTR